ncbi:unnamed protein product [Miscanthus lutarioriparius]|uniref:Uncharacterized protein n=1 Tax=Miscanthus lutarioriparius TaxID=422564 RepID=A0A811QAE0_9POAL|nr:unnamed protein product [Miscanthus lutarioriparius]
MAAAAATGDPPGYFVGRPLHYQEQQPQAVPPPAPAPAVDDHNAVNAQVPGYYAGRVQPRPSDGTGNNNNNNNNNNADTADQQNREPSFFAKWFGCFSGSS